MIDLRDELKKLDPTLSGALENSWQVARDEWLATLKMESESHGGLPHVEQVEDCMNRIADACKPSWSRYSTVPFGFNAVEIYIALCGVLFHDIGRGRKAKSHGTISKDIIAKHWAELGIQSERIATEIGNICEFHTYEKWTHHDVVTIHPWGMVHSEAVAALLMLADELDTAYTRAAPKYIKDPEMQLEKEDVSFQDIERFGPDYFTKGLYREFISAVDLEPGSRLIKTVLFSNRLPGQLPKPGKCKVTEWLGWLKEMTDLDPEKFSPEDYFFNFLETLSRTVDGEVLNILVEYYLKSNEFKRMELIQELDVPGEYANFANLHYCLYLWDRQLPTTNPVRRSMHKALGRLDRTCQLVWETFSAVDGLLSAGGSDMRTRILQLKCENDVEKLSHTLFRWSLELEQAEKSAGEFHTQEEKADEAKKKLEKLKALFRDHQKHPPKQHGSIPVLLATRGAHEALKRVFFGLLHVDLYAYANERDKFAVRPRPWESCGIDGFHRNLVLAFHIYLLNVRRLWVDEDNLDYRYLAAGHVESVFSDHGEHKDVRKLLFDSAHLLQILPAQDKQPTRNPKVLAEKVLKQDLENFFRIRRGGAHNSMNTIDFEYAVRFFFMSWLAKDVEEKNRKLAIMKSGLRRLGITFDEWLVEYNNHLFDSKWRLRLEPSLRGKMMVDLMRKAVDLQCSVHGDDSRLPWDMLAAELRDPRMDRVRTATNRLANIIRIYNPLRQPENKTNEAGTAAPPGVADPKTDQTLHFGHLLLADLLKQAREAENKNGRKGASQDAALETSHASWTFTFAQDQNKEELKNELAELIERIHEHE